MPRRDSDQGSRGPFGAPFDVALDEGIPAALPALARAQKVMWRMEHSGRLEPVLVAGAAQGEPVTEALLRAVLEAQRAGLDAESLLRAAVGRLINENADGAAPGREVGHDGGP